VTRSNDRRKSPRNCQFQLPPLQESKLLSALRTVQGPSTKPRQIGRCRTTRAIVRQDPARRGDCRRTPRSDMDSKPRKCLHSSYRPRAIAARIPARKLVLGSMLDRTPAHWRATMTMLARSHRAGAPRPAIPIKPITYAISLMVAYLPYLYLCILLRFNSRMQMVLIRRCEYGP
jgi:hypothetical protein